MTVIPKSATGRTPIWGKLFKECKSVGFNFFVPFSIKKQVEFGSTVHAWNKKLAPWHFITRIKDANGNQEEVNGKKGFRVWRDK